MTAHAIEYWDPRTDQRLPPAPCRDYDRPNLSIVAVQGSDNATENLSDIKLWGAGSQRTMRALDRFIAWSRTDSDDESRRLVSPSEIEEVAPPSSAGASLTERAGTILDKLTTLGRGWDGYDGIPIQHHTVRRAQEFLKAIEEHTQIMPDIVPISNGGLQLEWFVGDYEVEVEIDSSPSGTIQISFECIADERCVEIQVNGPIDVSGIAPYFKELCR